MNEEIIDALLTAMVQSADGVSDLLFAVGRAPLVEQFGKLIEFPIDSGELTQVQIDEIATYLMHVAKTSEERPPHLLGLALTFCGAALVSGISYAYFYSYYGVNTGVNNRVTIAAAVAVAISSSVTALLSRSIASTKFICWVLLRLTNAAWSTTLIP